MKRGNHYFIPRGNTKLKLNDRLLVINEDMETLNETYKNMAIEDE